MLTTKIRLLLMTFPDLKITTLLSPDHLRFSGTVGSCSMAVCNLLFLCLYLSVFLRRTIKHNSRTTEVFRSWNLPAGSSIFCWCLREGPPQVSPQRIMGNIKPNATSSNHSLVFPAYESDKKKEGVRRDPIKRINEGCFVLDPHQQGYYSFKSTGSHGKCHNYLVTSILLLSPQFNINSGPN